MDRAAYNYFLPALIAVITTLAATSYTSYLLTRPWCMVINSDHTHQIIYGQSNCAAHSPSRRMIERLSGSS